MLASSLQQEYQRAEAAGRSTFCRTSILQMARPSLWVRVCQLSGGDIGWLAGRDELSPAFIFTPGM